MSFILGKSLDGFVEFPVFLLALLLLEGSYLVLLLEEPALDLLHVLVSLEHFCEVVIGSVDWNLSLNQDFHGAHDILSVVVVERDFSFDVLVQFQALGSLCHCDWCRVGDRHVLRERNAACLLDELTRLKSVVEALLYFVQTLFKLIEVVDRSLAKGTNSCLLILFRTHLLQLIQLCIIPFKCIHRGIVIFIILFFLGFFTLFIDFDFGLLFKLVILLLALFCTLCSFSF